MPGLVAVGHSHRPTTKVSYKAFKSRKATKGAVRDASKGRINREERGQRKTPHQQVMSRFDRRNQARQRQLGKLKERLKEASVFAGKDGAPRNVAVIPLCADGDAHTAIRSLNGSIDIDIDIDAPDAPTTTTTSSPKTAAATTAPGTDGACFRVPVDRFKQSLQYLPLTRDLDACLDAARVADFVVLVLSAAEEVDELGALILRSVDSQGLSTVFTVVQGLDKVEPAKQRGSVVASLKSYITHFHPDQDKLYSLDSRQECSNLMRSLCNAAPKGVRWRDDRSWMLVEQVQFGGAGGDIAVLTGVVRGRGLKTDRLVQVGDWGVFQIDKITAAPLSTKSRKGKDSMVVDETADETTLDTASDDKDDLAELAPEGAFEDVDMNDDAATTMTVSTKKGVLLDEHHYFSDDDEPEANARPKRLPKGTSSYQAAWFLDDDVSDSDSDMDDEYEMKDAGVEAVAQPEDGMEGRAGDAQTEAGGASEYPQSEMFIEPGEEEHSLGLEEYRKKKRDEAEEDKEFPDEIELHPKVLARERLAKYRGLKSLRTSPWLEDEDAAYEPEDWQRLLRIPDYKASRARSMREALVGGVAGGTRVHVHIKGVPAAVQASYDPSSQRPVTLFSLLRHENKRTVVNFLIKLSADYPASIRSKEEMVLQCGPRRLVIKPIFSQGGTTSNDVHKYCRYLHPGQSAVATFMGPVTWGSVPALFYKRTTAEEASATAAKADNQSEDADDGDHPTAPTLPLTLAGTGTALAPSTSRVVAKRAILTGHPYQIHKKVVSVRYMFFNKEDVEWFKALPLWTRRGRTGHVKESLGTHGYFKATFDGRINPQDAIGISLYKRVWPRPARVLDGPLMAMARGVDGGEGGEMVDEDMTV